MSRASEAARKAYPEDWVAGYFDDPDEVTDDNEEAREYFQQGYELAEKATIERAESHIESVLLNFLDVDTVKWIIKDFKKAMEEE